MIAQVLEQVMGGRDYFKVSSVKPSVPLARFLSYHVAELERVGVRRLGQQAVHDFVDGLLGRAALSFGWWDFGLFGQSAARASEGVLTS
jgi:hypothetical protein